MITRESMLETLIDSASKLARAAQSHPAFSGYVPAREGFLDQLQTNCDRVNDASLKRSDVERLIASALVFMAEGQLLAEAQNTATPVIPREGAVMS